MKTTEKSFYLKAIATAVVVGGIIISGITKFNKISLTNLALEKNIESLAGQYNALASATKDLSSKIAINTLHGDENYTDISHLLNSSSENTRTLEGMKALLLGHYVTLEYFHGDMGIIKNDLNNMSLKIDRNATTAVTALSQLTIYLSIIKHACIV